MRIVLANYRYFVSSGPERYLFSLARALEKAGHEAVPFSIRYDRNEPTPWKDYFVPPLGRDDEIYFRDHSWTPATLARTLARLFHDPAVARAAARLARDAAPDCALMMQYLRKLSPAVLAGFKGEGVPVLARLSDYAMLCPQGHCVRRDAACTLCVSGRLWPSVIHRCVQGRAAASLAQALATRYHRAADVFRHVDRFITPSAFLRRMMVEAGWGEERVVHLPTFTDLDHFRPTPDTARDAILYVGRLDPPKGVHVLVEAYARLVRRGADRGMRLLVAGSGSPEYERALHEQVDEVGLGDRVSFLGQVDENELPALFGRALVSAVPSLWFENRPNALLESLACGVPVLASDLGSLPECVRHGETGVLFPPGDAAALAGVLEDLLAQPKMLTRMGAEARLWAEAHCAAEDHVRALLALAGGLG